jgi:hypothetical protein
MSYPAGIELVQSGRCPNGAMSPIACMFCSSGHMLECHYPMDCQEAQCFHLTGYASCEDVFNLDSESEDEDELFDPPDACEYCGCTEYHACSGGCAWSRKYAEQGRLICTSCEALLRLIALNQAVLRIIIDRKFAEVPDGKAAR